jgi:hypothetical protein
MKASINTLDKIVVHKPVEKHNLYLDKGYDFPEIERESIKRRYVPHIRHRGEVLMKVKYSARMWIVERKNKFMAQQIQKVIINKMRKEIRELSRTGVFSLLYYCI